MTITLINCGDKISTLGIDINAIGGWDQLRNQLNAKISLLSSGYDIDSQTITIEVEDGSLIPDLSMFGEVQTNVSN